MPKSEQNSGIAVEETNDQTGSTETVEAVRPVGFQEFVRWYVPLARQGLTTAELVEKYPGPIKPGSFSAKLSKVFKEAEAKGIKLPRPKRASGGRGKSEVDIDALVAELNLEKVIADETETEG